MWIAKLGVCKLWWWIGHIDGLIGLDNGIEWFICEIIRMDVEVKYTSDEWVRDVSSEYSETNWETECIALLLTNRRFQL